MRTYLYILTCFIAILKFHKTVSENQWKGDTAFFLIEEGHISSQFNPDQSYAEIAKDQHTTGECIWEITVEMDFNPSVNNHTTLLMNGEPLTEHFLNGYYVAVGKNDDVVQFYVRKNGKDSLLINGIEKRLNLSPLEIHIRITRSYGGGWQLFSKLSDEQTYVLEGSANHVLFSEFYTFAIGCTYTKTRVNKFQFSDLKIEGRAFLDTIAPKFVQLNVLNASTLEIIFDESIEAKKENFSLKDSSNEIESIEIKNASVLLKLQNALQKNISYNLSIQHVTDVSGNITPEISCEFIFVPVQLAKAFVLSENSVFAAFSKPVNLDGISQHVQFGNVAPSQYFEVGTKNNAFIFLWDSTFRKDTFLPFSISGLSSLEGNELLDTVPELAYHELTRGDIMISEIMSDPSPPVILPEVEYIELYNNSMYDISYQQFQLFVNDKIFDLEGYDFIAPQSFILVVNSKDLESFDLINIASSSSSFSLVNGGFEIAVTTDKKVIDYFDYDPSLIFPEFKSNGGWAAERKDNETKTNDNNWGASEDLYGGTPGLKNSISDILVDHEIPEITSIFVNSDTSLTVVFSEVLERSQLADLNRYTLSGANIDSVFVLFPSQKEVEISLSAPLQAFKDYTLNIKPLSDLEGNLTEENTFSFQLPETPEFNDVVINEIMFEPLSGCSEYIELVNTSNKYIDLSHLILTEQDEEGNLKEGTQLFKRPLLMAPKSYLIVAKSTESFEICYQASGSAYFVTPSSFPALNNTSQNIALVTSSGQIIDELTYFASWHTELLATSGGVALEKIHPKLPSKKSNSWTSASSLVGYATPGYRNSQLISQKQTTSQISLAYKNISPNNDGYQDGLVLSIPETYSGYSVSIQIFDTDGRMKSELCNNYFLGTQNTFTWNGFVGEKIYAGIYAVRIRGVHPTKKTFEEMLPFVVSFK